MSKLGYTWYPKDWKTNDKVFNLSLELRGLYREFIDFAYEKDNSFTVEHKYWCRMLDINKRKFDTLFARLLGIGLIVKNKETYYIPSVENRIQLIRGGKNSKPTPKPTHKPTPKQRERERETKIERERETTDDVLFDINILKEKYLNDKKLISAILNNKKLDFQNTDHLKKILNEFNIQLSSKNIFSKTWKDYTSHFLNWYRKLPIKEIKPKRNKNVAEKLKKYD